MGLRKTSIKDLEGLLSSLGVEPGKVVMLHSTVFTLGLIEKGLAGLYQALRNLLGDAGTLIAPTFTYSFRRNQVFDIRHTPAPAEIGVFSEYVRKLPGTVRSADPLFSMAAIGPHATNLMERSSHNCFGMGSIYEKIFAVDALFVGLGITYSTGLACFMHLERMANVDYRREIRFSGQSIGYDGDIYDDWAIHFARDENRYPTAHTDRDPLGHRMEERGISKGFDFRSGHHVAFHAQVFEEYVLSELAKDPTVMLVDSPVSRPSMKRGVEKA